MEEKREGEKKKKRKRKRRRREAKQKGMDSMILVWKLTLSMDSSMDHMDFVWNYMDHMDFLYRYMYVGCGL